MRRGASAYGARKRTEADKARDAYAFIFNARPAALLAITAERLCNDKGVTNRNIRREIEVKLLVAQAKERERIA